MYVIEIIPYAALPANVPQLLSYFHDTPLRKGALVEVAIGRRRERAVVVFSTPLEQQKGSLKKSFYQLKKISKILNPEPCLNNVQFKILLWLARHYYAPLGLCLKTILPSFILNKSLTFYEQKVRDLTPDITKKKEPFEKPAIMVCSADDFENELVKAIRSGTGQILIIAPDLRTAGHFKKLLSEFEPVIAHSSQGIKEKFNNWQRIQNGAKVVLGTRQVLFYPFKNLGQIFVEDSLNEMYKSDMTPKYNASDLAEKIASFYGSKIIIHTPLASVSQYYNSQNENYSLVNLKNKKISNTKIINTINELRAGNFGILSRELKSEILLAIDREEKILLFSPRKGYSGFLFCQNCGASVKCPNCDIPMRVHKTTELILICHRCSQTQKFPPFCKNCNSYKLKTSGPSGSQKIYDEIREFLSVNGQKIPILILDSEVVKNDTEEDEIISEVEKPEPIILIGTQMVFSHRYDFRFSLISLINADSLSVFPEYNIEERFFYQVNKLLDFKPAKIIIQTYSSESKTYEILDKLDYEKFYQQELESRKMFNYPPYCRLAKLSYRHTNQNKALVSARILLEKLRMAAAHEKLNDKVTILSASPAFISKEKGFYISNIILKLSPALDNPRDILKYVPSDWLIDLDPKTLL